MTKTIRVKKPTDPLQADIDRLLIGKRSVAERERAHEAVRILREFQDSIGYQPVRTAAQKEMLADIPPITAFMGMGG